MSKMIARLRSASRGQKSSLSETQATQIQHE